MLRLSSSFPVKLDPGEDPFLMKCEGSGGESPGIWPLLCSKRITSMHKMLVEDYRYNANDSVRQMHF
jgi:hypothetical protein